MRGSVRRHVTLDAPAATAWRVVGRPEVLHLWFPGIVDCQVEGDQRTITLASGLTMHETILTNDALQRRFQYRVEGGIFVEHLASIDVIALTDRTCLVTYASDADPAPMAVVLGGAAERALAELRRQLTSGGPAVEATTDPPGTEPPATRPHTTEGARR
jgi:carbon monoxide dehydrogenase subunit G